MGNGSACMGRTGTSRSCLSGLGRVCGLGLAGQAMPLDQSPPALVTAEPIALPLGKVRAASRIRWWSAGSTSPPAGSAQPPRSDSGQLPGHGGSEPITARDLGGLGTALLNLGDLPRARAVLDESLVVARRYEDRWSSAMSLMLLGHVNLAEGDDIRARAVLAEAGALFQATGNMVYLPWCLEGLASLAAVQGDYKRAAELAGARDALRDQIGVFLPPVHPAGYARVLEAARASLTPSAFDAAHARPAGQPPPQIVAAAMSGLDTAGQRFGQGSEQS